jgi:hypothetical protein
MDKKLQRSVILLFAWPWRLARAFWKWRAPQEQQLERALLVGSAPHDVVLKVIDHLALRLPHLRLAALLHDGVGDGLRAKYPQMEIESLDRIASRRRLLIGLWRQDLDLTIIVLGGGGDFRRDQMIGLLSGPRYMMTCNSCLESVYWGIGPIRSLFKYLQWRSLSLQWRPPSIHWDFDVRLRPGYLLILVGYFVVLVSVLPLLLRAAFSRDDTDD